MYTSHYMRPGKGLFPKFSQSDTCKGMLDFIMWKVGTQVSFMWAQLGAYFYDNWRLPYRVLRAKQPRVILVLCPSGR